MKRPGGFTLIELSVVIAIMGILLAFVLANLQKGQRNTQLRMSAQQLVDDIRSAQNMTLVGTTIPVCRYVDPTDANTIKYKEDCSQVGASCTDNAYTCTSIVPPGGFGIYFNKDQQDRYTIFGDYGKATRVNSLNNVYKSNPVIYSTEADSVVRIVPLPPNVNIDMIKITSQFDPPTGVTCILNGSSKTFYPWDGTNGQQNSSVALAWTLPKGQLYANFMNINFTNAPNVPVTPPNCPCYLGVNNPCPDYLITIQMKQTQTLSCRTITINGASGLVDEVPGTACALLAGTSIP